MTSRPPDWVARLASWEQLRERQRWSGAEAASAAGDAHSEPGMEDEEQGESGTAFGALASGRRGDQGDGWPLYGSEAEATLPPRHTRSDYASARRDGANSPQQQLLPQRQREAAATVQVFPDIAGESAERRRDQRRLRRREQSQLLWQRLRGILPGGAGVGIAASHTPNAPAETTLAAVAAAARLGADGATALASRLSMSGGSASASSSSSTNTGGVLLTFRVNICGIPPAVRANQAPWPVCRVKLVGCPGGRSNPSKPYSCGEQGWRVSRTLDMTPEKEGDFGVFTVSTNIYGPGDEFAFVLVNPGCDDAAIEQELRSRSVSGGVVGGGSNGGIDGGSGGACEMRFDSGHTLGNHLRYPGRNAVSCWSPDGSTVENGGGGGGSGDAGFSGSALRQIGKGESLCHSVAPPTPNAGCLLRREAHYPEGAFHRVVPSSGTDVEFVWGTCDAAPRSSGWCEPPNFDVGKVAGACGVSVGIDTRSITTANVVVSAAAKGTAATVSAVVEKAQGGEAASREAVDPAAATHPGAGSEMLSSSLLLRPSAALASSAVTTTSGGTMIAAAALTGSAVAPTEIHETQHNISDIFNNSQESPTFVHEATWAETAPHTVDLGGGAIPHSATAHLTLRDGDRFFATEHAPWAQLIVNGESATIPAVVRTGDVIVLRVRAETRAEIEEDAESWVEGQDPVRIVVVRYGSPTQQGVLRCRVYRRHDYVKAYLVGKGADAPTVTDIGTLPEGDDGSTFSSSPAVAAASAPPLDLTPKKPQAPWEMLTVTAPGPKQWMLVPALDQKPITVTGLGPNVKAALTVRFGDGEEGSGERQAPAGNVNGVIAKVGDISCNQCTQISDSARPFAALEAPEP